MGKGAYLPRALTTTSKWMTYGLVVVVFPLQETDDLQQQPKRSGYRELKSWL
jgi:hypothetical protein